MKGTTWQEHQQADAKPSQPLSKTTQQKKSASGRAKAAKPAEAVDSQPTENWQKKLDERVANEVAAARKALKIWYSVALVVFTLGVYLIIRGLK